MDNRAPRKGDLTPIGQIAAPPLAGPTVPAGATQKILDLARRARELADAFIVVGIMPGGEIFYDCDDRIPLPDLHGFLIGSIDFICESIARKRARKTEERTNHVPQ